jgi:hypothetical protein
LTGHSRWRYWAIILLFAGAAAVLYILRDVMSLPALARNLSGAVGDALVVAVVVSLVVEPRLLRYFGEELATQTFWSSFYSRAPDPYREAIKELAAMDQFCVAAHWDVALDWADDQKTAVRMSVRWAIHRENRGSKPHGLKPGIMMYESTVPGLAADIGSYAMLCPQSAFHTDLLADGRVRIEHARDGRLLALPADDHARPYFHVPPGQRYTHLVSATTYVASNGVQPITVTSPTLQFTIQFTGTALPDLYLSVLHPGMGSITSAAVEGTGTELAARGRIQIGGVFVTGQAVLLLWKPL